MWRAAVVCCWQGTVWKGTVHIVCVCVCALIHLSALDSPSVRDESVLTRNYVTRWNKRKRSKQTLSSPGRFHCQSVLCVQPHVWTRDPSGLGSQLNRLFWRNRVRARTLPGQSSFICSVYQSVTGCVYVYGSSRPSWPRCPDSPPLSSASPPERHYRVIQFSSLRTDYYKCSAVKLWLLQVACNHLLLISGFTVLCLN